MVAPPHSPKAAASFAGSSVAALLLVQHRGWRIRLPHVPGGMNRPDPPDKKIGDDSYNIYGSHRGYPFTKPIGFLHNLVVFELSRPKQGNVVLRAKQMIPAYLNHSINGHVYVCIYIYDSDTFRLIQYMVIEFPHKKLRYALKIVTCQFHCAVVYESGIDIILHHATNGSIHIIFIHTANKSMSTLIFPLNAQGWDHHP